MGDVRLIVPPSIAIRRTRQAQPCNPFFVPGKEAKYYEITKALWAASEKAMLVLEQGKDDFAHGYWADARGKFSIAIELFKSKIKSQPELAGEISKKMAECHGNCGYALLRLGDRAGALAEFGTALKLDSTCFEAHLYLGHALLPGDPEAANLQYLLAFESVKNKILKYYDIKGELELDLPYSCHCIAASLSRLGERDDVKRKVAAVYYEEAAGLYRDEIKKHPEQEAGLSQLLQLCEEGSKPVS